MCFELFQQENSKKESLVKVNKRRKAMIDLYLDKFRITELFQKTEKHDQIDN